ncbi:MAG: efflux RND transporter periplasmic adaptor subunit [Chloroflexi bacterium]|nr:efflux RND transporter periplasmic adaptor subunit [Chloroflexota bacterium]
MSVRRSLILLALLMFSLPALAFAFRTNTLRRGDPVRNWQIHSIQRGTVAVTVTAIGVIEADTTVKLSFVEMGRVAEVLVQPGEVVEAGDILARLADDNQRIAYEQAVLSLRLAELQKQALLEPPEEWEIRAAEANVASAQAAYTSILTAISDDEIRAAELRYQQALTAEADARSARVEADGGYPDEYYQILDAQIGAAAFNVEIARLQLEALRNPDNDDQLGLAGARIAQAQRELERLKAGPSPTEIDRADVAIRQAQVQVEQAELALNRRALTAPFSGLVSVVNLEEGVLIVAGQPVIELVDAAPLRLTVQVDEIDIRQIQTGMPADIELDALPGLAFPATLEQIALLGRNEEGIISYDVRLLLEAPDPRVRVGMTAEASIIVEDRQDVLVVPNNYIRLDRDTDQAFVNVLAPDGTLDEKAITLGLRGQETSEIVSGLAAGDIIVIDLASPGFEFLGG